MNEKNNSQILYEGLISNPKIKGLPETYDDFKKNIIDNPKNRKILYEGLIQNPAIKGLPETYQDFEKIFLPKTPSPNQKVEPSFQKDESNFTLKNVIDDLSYNPAINLLKHIGKFTYEVLKKPSKEVKEETAKIFDKIDKPEKPKLTQEQFNEKLLKSFSNTLQKVDSLSNTDASIESLNLLEDLGVQYKQGKDGKNYFEFQTKFFTDEEKEQYLKNVDDIALVYNKEIDKIKENFSEIDKTLLYTKYGSLLPLLFPFEKSKNFLREESIKNLNKIVSKKIEELEDEKNFVLGVIKDQIGVTKPQALTPNEETGIVATLPLKDLDFSTTSPQEVSSTISYANLDLEQSLSNLRAISNPDIPFDNVIKNQISLQLVEKGLEQMYSSNPNLLKIKKNNLTEVVFKNEQKPSIEQQEAIFQAIKREQESLLSSIEDGTKQKEEINNIVTALYNKVQKGEKLTPKEETLFNNFSASLSLLERNINLQKEVLKEYGKTLESLAPAYRGFLEEQIKYDKIAEMMPKTTALYAGAEEIVKIPLKVARFGAAVGFKMTDDAEAYDRMHMKTSPSFRIEDEGQMKDIKEVEAISLFDEEGNFKLSYNLPALIYTTTKVSGESFILGSTMLGTRALMAATVERKLAQWAAGGSTSEIGISQILPTNPLLTPFKQLGREATKALIMGTGDQAAFLSPLYIGESIIGSAVPSVLMFGDEMIQNEIKQGLSFNEALYIGSLRAGVEGVTERMFPNEMHFVKGLIGKGEIKTLEQLAKNEVYKKAIFDAYKKITGRTLSQKAYDFLTKTGEFAKSFFSVGVEESLEEIGGLFMNDKLVNPIARGYNPDYKGEEFTAEAIVNTGIATMATMLPMMTRAGYANVRQHTQSQKAAQMMVGQNPKPYYEMTLSLFKEGAISEEEFQRRSQLINKYKDSYQEAYKNTFVKALTEKYTEDQAKEYLNKVFNSMTSIEELKKAVVENPEDDKVFQLYEQEELELQTLLEKGLFSSEEERVSNVITSLDFYLTKNNINLFSKKDAESTIKKLQNYYEQETNDASKKKYDEKIQLLNKRVEDLQKIEEEEKKTIEQKAKDAEIKGVIEIPTKKGERNFTIGKKYIVNRQIDFDSKNPIKFPEVTFLGYKKDENGNIVEQDGTPVVLFQTKNTKGQLITAERPISVFSQYSFTTEEKINETEEGRFYNKFKNKKFEVSLSYKDKDGKLLKNKFFKRLEKLFAVTENDVIEGVLSIEMENNKPVVYFNFKAKDKKGNEREGYIQLNDTDISNINQYGQRSSIRPKSKTYVTSSGKKIIKEGYEEITPEDLDEYSLFTEEEKSKYDEYLQSKEFSELKKRRLIQEGRRRGYIQEYINKISEPLIKISQDIQNLVTKSNEYSDFLESASIIKSLLNTAKFSEITEDQIKKVLPKSQLNSFNKLNNIGDKIFFIDNYLNKKVDDIYKKATSLSNKLASLEEKKETIQPIIDQEIEFLESIEIESLDFTTSITKQLKERRKNLKELLLEKEVMFSNNRSILDKLIEAIENIKSIITPLFQSFKEVVSPSEFSKSLNLSEKLNELNSKLTTVQKDLSDIEVEKQEIASNIKSLTKLINYLNKFEKQFETEMRDLRSQELKKFIFEENESSNPATVSTNSLEEDKQYKDDSSKKSISTLLSSTTSWGFNYAEKLKDPRNNYANARLDYFLNNQKSTGDLLLLPITKKNASQYNLQNILTPGMEDSDIQMVVVKYGKSRELVFIDMNGEVLSEVSSNNVIYTPLPLINSTKDLINSQGGVKYNENELSSLSEKERNDFLEKAVLDFKQFRDNILSSDKPDLLSINSISRGIPSYSGKDNEEFIKNPVRGNLLPLTYTSFKGLIKIITVRDKEGSKTGTLTDHSNNPVTVPIGRPILYNKDTKTFQFLDNHKLTSSQKEVVKKVLYELAVKARDNFKEKSIDPNFSKKILDSRILSYLSGIVYWRNPNRIVNGQKQAEISRNQMWIDYNQLGELGLFYGKEKLFIPFTEIIAEEGNSEAMNIIAEELFHNVNVDLLGKYYVEFYLQDGKLKERTWESYEDYLLSDKLPNTFSRNNNEIPLTTNIIPPTSPFDDNNTFNENFKPQYESKYIIFDRKVNVPFSEEPKKEPTPSTKPSSQSLIVKTVDSIVEGYINEVKEVNKKVEEKIEFWKNFITKAKEGVLYSIPPSNPSSNDGNPYFSFSVKIKDGRIIVDNFESELSNNISEIFTNNNIPVTKQDLQEILDLFSYNTSVFPTGINMIYTASILVEKPLVDFVPEEEFKKAMEEDSPPPPPSSERIIKRNAKDRRNISTHRIAKGVAKTKINIEEAKKWLKQRFPNLEIKIISDLIDGIAWGKFTEKGIILSEAAEIGTEYHEAFELVAGLFLNKRQWNSLEREFKNRKGTFIDRETGRIIKYSEATSHEIKEELAEEYREYELSGGKFRWEGEINKNSLFRRIWNHIKSLIFGDPKDINEIFSRISSAYYKDKTPIKWNRPFNLEKSYRIADLQDDLFFRHLNNSLTYQVFYHIKNSDNNLSRLFKADENYLNNLYANVKKNIINSYIGIGENNEGNILTDYGYNSISDVIEDYDNFIENLIKTYQEGYAIPNTLDYLTYETSEEKLPSLFYNEYKNHLISLQYILSNWEDIINQHTKYLSKYRISYEGELSDIQIEETTDSSITTVEEEKNSVGRDEYTKDPFSLFLKDTANNKVKFIIASLVKAKLTGTKDNNGVDEISPIFNSIGLPETVNFSKTFRKVVTTVIEDSNIEEMLESIKKAIPTNPEFRNLYLRLGGNKTLSELTKDEFELRVAFSQSLNKHRVGFSRLILRDVTKGRGENKTTNLVSNLINSLQSTGVESIVKRYIENIKSNALKNNWTKESVIEIPNSGMPENNKNLSENIKFLEKIGFDFPYSIETLSKEELALIVPPINEIMNFIRKGDAKLEEIRYFNFSSSVRDLAKAELEITKDPNETQHRNIDNQAQSNDISQNSFSIVSKILNKVSSIEDFIKTLPRFNDIYTQNAFWRKLYFDNSRRNKTKISFESAEGVISHEGKGKHTSKLPLNTRLLQEFIYNIYNDKKGLRSPGFYIITPADIKTEFVIKYGREFLTPLVTNSIEDFFNIVAKNYLIDEINLARELTHVDDRNLKAYNSNLADTPYVKGLKVKNALRFYHDILKFDYTDVINNQNINIEEWIDFNKNAIISNLEDFINNQTEITFNRFLEEQIITETTIGANTYYDFYGMDEYLMEWIDSNFQTNLKELNKRYNATLFTESELKDLIRYRNVNYFININEQSKLFLGDFGQYKDLTKRVKSFTSTRESTVYDTPLTEGVVFTQKAKELYNKAVYTDKLGNTEEVELIEGTPGYQSFNNEFLASTIDDVEVVQTSINNIEEKHYNELSQSLFFSDFLELSEKAKKYILQKVSKVLSPFSEVNEADAQAYMALPLYRQFLLRSSMWSDGMEELYQYFMAYERQKRNNYPNNEYGNKLSLIDEKIVEEGNPNLKRVANNQDIIDFPILKPIGAGVRPGDKFIVTLDKNSVLPIHYQLLENKPSLQTYLSAIDNNTQYMRFKSAHKVGTPSNIVSPYSYNGVSTAISITDELSFMDFGIQVETRGLKNKVTRATQPLKIPLLNIFESGVPSDFIKTISNDFQEGIASLKDMLEDFNPNTYFKEWSNLHTQIVNKAKELWNNLEENEKTEISPIYSAAQKHNNILKSLTNRYFSEISEEFSLQKEGNVLKIKDFTKFKEALHKQLKDRDAANNLIKQIEVENGKMVQPFDFIIGADKLEPVLLSILNKNVVQPNINGRALAQVASTFFENKPRIYVKKIENKDGTFSYEEVENPETYPNKKDLILTSNELLFYGDMYMEDEKGNTRKATKEEIESGKAKEANFIEVYLPQIFKDKLGRFITDVNKIDSQLLQAVGFRIPTQELSSMENIRIKGFLPLEYQNGVVVPSSITAKAGSDFDIDKLNIYLYHYTYSAKQDKVIKTPYLDSSTSAEERYIAYIKSNLKKYDEKLKDDEISDSLKQELFTNLGKIWTKTIKEIFKNLPELNQTSAQFKSTIGAIKELRNKSLSKQIADILYSKESMFDKYETITEILQIESNKQLFEEKQTISNIQKEIDLLFSLSEVESETISWLKKTMKNTIGYASLKGQMKETANDVLANYIFQYNIQIPEVPSYSSFIELSIDEQNTTEALENKYIESIQNLLTLPENFTRLTNPNSTYTLKKLAEYIDRLKDAKKEQQSFATYLSPIENSLTRYAFQVGKEGVGIGAVQMTNIAVNQLVDTIINDPSINEISLLFPNNETISYVRDSQGNFISDNTSEFINAFVDVAKDPFIIRINGTLSTASTYIVGNKIGISLEDMVLLINQPIIVDYEKHLEFTSSPIGKLRIKQGGQTAFAYTSSRIKIKYGEQKEEYTPKEFSKSELEEMITASSFNEEQNQHQLALLNVYLKIKDLANSLREAVSTYNYDTDTAKYITDVLSKIDRENTYLQNPKIELDVKNTFFQNIKDATIEYTSALMPLFNTFSSLYYPLIAPIYKRLNNITDSNSRQSALADVKKGLANFLLLTYNNSQLQNQISSILLTDDVLNQIKSLKKKIENGEMEENFAITEMFPLPADKINKKTFNLTLFNKESTGEYIDLIANSLKQLESYPEYSLLTKRIYTLALLQSGMNTSFISLSQFIPHDVFTKLAKEVVENPNTSLFPHFQQMFYANKWKDSKFTLRSKTLPKIETNISSKPILLVSGVYMQEGKPKVNSLNYSHFQMSTYVLEETEGVSKKYRTRIFQRVEDNESNPILILSKNGWDFLYREVTPLGDGQNALEYSLTSQLNENIQSESPEQIIQNIISNLPQDSYSDLKTILEESDVANDVQAQSQEPSLKTKEEVQLSKEQSEAIALQTNFDRNSVKNDRDYIYLFTDNAGRTSGKNSLDYNSWYSKKYTGGYPLNYPSMTQAVIRGLENAFPITTMVDDKRTQWTDDKFEQYKKIIDDEINTIKEALPNYKGIKFSAQMPFGKGQISDMKTKAPKIWNYLNSKLLEIGIDNTGAKPIVSKEVQLTSTQDSSEIYSQLGNKTQSENVKIKSWGELKDATKAITPEGIISTRIANAGDNHFGNPFSSREDLIRKGAKLILRPTVKDSVESYIKWILTGQTDEYIFDQQMPDPADLDFQREWILEQLKLGELKGKPIFYYKELGEPSHATALDYLINKYDWNKTSTQDLPILKELQDDSLDNKLVKFINSLVPNYIKSTKDKLNIVSELASLRALSFEPNTNEELISGGKTVEQMLKEYTPQELKEENRETLDNMIANVVLGKLAEAGLSEQDIWYNLFDKNKPQTSTQDLKPNVVAIIGTAGRKEVPSKQEWENMVKDAERRVSKNDILISGGAAFADHIAVKLFLDGKVSGLRLRLPAPFKNGKFEGAYGTSGGAANYYHQQFSRVIGENTLAQIQEAIDKGAEVTYEPLAQGYNAMMNRNTKVANESNKMLAYTYGEGNIPADGGTKDTWDKSRGEKTHISIKKIDLTQPQTSTQEKELKTPCDGGASI